MNRIVVHVDRLLINGFCHKDGNVVAAGLQLELKRLLADPQWSAHRYTAAQVSLLHTNRVQLGHVAHPLQIGFEAARAIANKMSI